MLRPNGFLKVDVFSCLEMSDALRSKKSSCSLLIRMNTIALAFSPLASPTKPDDETVN